MPFEPSEIIKRLRKERGITMIELAERMGVSQEYIVRIERGEIRPTQEQLEVIRKFLMES